MKRLALRATRMRKEKCAPHKKGVTTMDMIQIGDALIRIKDAKVERIETISRDKQGVLWNTIITRIEEPKKARRRTQ